MTERVVTTTAGLQLLAKLASASGELEFVRAAVGTGTISEESDPSQLVDLIVYKMDAVIADYGYDEETKNGYVVIQISNTIVNQGFVMTEVGLYAADPDSGEILYAYVDLSKDPNYIMPAENGRSKTVQFKLHIIVGESANITAVINPSSQVTRETFDREIVAIKNPEFDDSGEVEGIGSFPDFLARVKSKMNFFQFFRDFKAGMQFVLHVGDIVNNCKSGDTDKPLSAAQGKALMDLYTQLNSKLRVGADTTRMTFGGDVNENTMSLQANNDNDFTQIQFNSSGGYFGKYVNGKWYGIFNFATKGDLPKIEHVTCTYYNENSIRGSISKETMDVFIAPVPYNDIGIKVREVQRTGNSIVLLGESFKPTDSLVISVLIY